MIGNREVIGKVKNNINMRINSLIYLTSVYCFSDAVLDTGNTGMDKIDPVMIFMEFTI